MPKAPKGFGLFQATLLEPFENHNVHRIKNRSDFLIENPSTILLRDAAFSNALNSSVSSPFLSICRENHIGKGDFLIGLKVRAVGARNKSMLFVS